MGPLELLYSWQSLVCASAGIGVTKLLKTILDLVMTIDRRRGSKWISQVLLPMSPVIVCAAYAAFVPLRPEVLLDYVAGSVDGSWLQMAAYAAWGAAAGQFATMLHGKLKDFLQAAKPA